MQFRIAQSALAAFLFLALPFFAPPSVRADSFAVESCTKYDTGATSYTVPSSVNYVVVKKASENIVIWTKDELTREQLTAIESYARAHDPSLKDRAAIFISGQGDHYIDTMYGTITFAYGTSGLVVTMPRQWSHLDYGHYTEPEPEPEPEPDPTPDSAKLTIRKTVNGSLWRVRCDYMDVEGQDTCDVRVINGVLWKRDWISNPRGTTSLEGHRSNKCGDAEHWVIWVNPAGVPYRMDEIKSGATGGTLSTVVYRTKVEMTDEEIANVGNPERPECLEKYKRNFEEPMSYADVRTGKRLYWITSNGDRVWYHTGVPYEDNPSFIISVDGVPYVLTGGQSVEIEDLEPGLHEISETENPLYSLGTVVSSSGNLIQSENGWTVQIQIDEGEDVSITWPNIQPGPDPEPPVVHVDTICELLDFGKRFNAVIFGDLLTSGGDCEGNLLVWGKATLSAGYTVGLPGNAVDSRHDALIVGGDLVIGQQDVNGNVVYGGDYLGADRAWAGYALRHVTPVTIDRYGNVPADGSGRTSAELLAAVREVSTRVAAWKPNGTVTVREDGSLVLSGTDAVRNVFSVLAEQWSGSQRDWIFDVPAGSKIVVNVDGSFVELAYGRFVLPSGISCEDVLVNYTDATHLSFASVDHAGSVLAPYASGSFSGGAIEGGAILGGDVTTRNGFEFHNHGLDVFFCPTMPEVTVTATAAGAADGDIWYAEPGTQVQVTVVVGNPSDFWLHNVKLTDSNGKTTALGNIAPGTSVTTVQTLTVGDSGRFTYSATVTAEAYDVANGAIFGDRPSVSASDVAVAAVAAAAGSGGTASEGGDTPAGSGNTGNSGASSPSALADYSVEDMWFSCTPTFAGERFTVNVRVKNNGDAVGEGALLGIYLVDVDHGATIADGEAIDAVRSVEMGRIPAGGSRVYSFAGLIAPDASGVCRVIAYADMDNTQREWSKGDNQNNLTYELSQVNIRIALSAEGVTITWNNGWGQIYSILGSNDLAPDKEWVEIRTDSWVDGIGRDGSGGIPSARDTEGLLENTEFVPFSSGYQYFKLRIKQR